MAARLSRLRTAFQAVTHSATSPRTTSTHFDYFESESEFGLGFIPNSLLLSLFLIKQKKLGRALSLLIALHCTHCLRLTHTRTIIRLSCVLNIFFLFSTCLTTHTHPRVFWRCARVLSTHTHLPFFLFCLIHVECGSSTTGVVSRLSH